MLEQKILTDFLLLSTWQTVFFIFTLLALFKVIKVIENKKVPFSKRMILATVLGLVLGVAVQASVGFPKSPKDITWINEVSVWYSFVGDAFMNLLKMIVIPLIFLSIVRVIINMKGNNLSKMTSMTIGMLLGTTVIASIIGIVCANLIDLSQGYEVIKNDVAIRETIPMVQTLGNLVPSNIVKAMTEGNIVGVVIFATFIGLSIRRLSKKYLEIIDPFIKWIEASYKIIISVSMTIIKFMPYAVIAILANTILSNEIAILLSMIKFIGVIYGAIFLMLIVHMIINMVNGISPVNYIKYASEPLILAFTSRSSMGTMPVTIKTLKDNFKVNEGVAGFVASLGSNMGMNACAGIYPAVVTVMLAQITNTPMDIGFYITLLIVIAIGSFGIAGIPGTATIAISVVLSGMGMQEYFPIIGAVIAVDPIVDMGRTMLNVSGVITSAIVVDKSLEGEISEEQEEKAV